MRQKAEYKSAIRSRRLIREAFAELMSEKSIDKITVTDIIKKADINRGTFYAHYQDTRDVIVQIENEIIDKMNELLRSYKYVNFVKDPMPALLEIEKFLEADLDLFTKFINAHGSEQFLSKLRQMAINNLFNETDIPNEIKTNKLSKIRINFFVGGMINLYQSWFKKEIKCSLNDISKEIAKQVKVMNLLLEGKI